MPYITQDRRPEIDDGSIPHTAGELNYSFTKIIWDFYKANRCYTNIHFIKRSIEEAKRNVFESPLAQELRDKIVEDDAFDFEDNKVALDLAFLEFYRRVAAPYEDSAIERNGDVYE